MITNNTKNRNIQVCVQCGCMLIFKEVISSSLTAFGFLSEMYSFPVIG